MPIPIASYRVCIGAGLLCFSLLLTTLALGEVISVKYRGPVDLNHPRARFKCEEIARSSLVRRVCYESPSRYMIINLNGTYYHYCGIDKETVASLLAAGSMGRYYNQVVKGRFDCRVNPVPDYSPKN